MQATVKRVPTSTSLNEETTVTMDAAERHQLITALQRMTIQKDGALHNLLHALTHLK